MATIAGSSWPATSSAEKRRVEQYKMVDNYEALFPTFRAAKSNAKASAKHSTPERKPNAAIVQTETAVCGTLVGRQVPIRQLRPGMELLEDLYATTGIKLLPKGQVLTEVMAHRIIDLEKVINGDGIRVKAD